MGIDPTLLVRHALAPTPTYAALLDEAGGLVAAIADFRAVDDLSLFLKADDVAETGDAWPGNKFTSSLRKALVVAPAVIVDGNFPVAALSEV